MGFSTVPKASLWCVSFNIINKLTDPQVAMKVLVDNFAVLALEYCVADGLSGIFAPDTVMTLDDSLTSEIAAEIENSQTERHRASKKLTSLEAGLCTLNRLNQQKPAGKSRQDMPFIPILCFANK